MEYIHVSYIGGSSEKDDVVTLSDRVIEYKGRNILVQTNEYDTFIGSRVKTVNVAELLEPLYASSNNLHFVGLTRARRIEKAEDRKELTDIIRKLGVREPINF